MPSLRDLAIKNYQTDAEYAQSLLAARRRQIPSALREIEPSLQGGFQLGEVGGVPVSLTDIIPAEVGANTLASLGKIGAAKLGAVPAFAGMMNQRLNFPELISDVEKAMINYELSKIKQPPSTLARDLAVGAGALGGGTAAGYYGMGMVE